MKKTFLKYSKDILNKDILLSHDDKHQVMMEWEKPYMKECIEKLQPYGDVLEIGFGMGYSANEIQKYNITSHTIIECDEQVLKRLKKWKEGKDNKISILKGRWQDLLNDIPNKFDCVFFDDYPDINDLNYKDRFEHFFKKIIKNNMKDKITFCWFLDREIKWVVDNNMEWKCYKFYINIPENCTYIKNKDFLYIPILTYNK
jgi:hypothetical protein